MTPSEISNIFAGLICAGLWTLILAGCIAHRKYGFGNGRKPE